MSDLEIHAYNVGFGDAILIRIPRKRRTPTKTFRDVLIDCGNSLTKEGGDDAVLLEVMEHIHTLTGGKLDLYIMTHEHMDHVQGLAVLKKRSGKTFKSNRVWMTGSSRPGYYDDHPEARKRFQMAQDFLGFARSLGLEENDDFRTLLSINNPRRTQDCVDLIRTELAPNSKVHYLDTSLSQQDINAITPFKEASFQILAPEEDTSVYYGRMQALTASGTPFGAQGRREIRQALMPPQGVSLSDFNRLVAARDMGIASNALMIDKAGNNSSIVFQLGWQGRRLLFAADAEEKSWHLMRMAGVLEPADFLKISHHGSHNGTPDHVFDTVLAGRDGQRPVTLVSTFEGQYNGVPQDELLNRIASVSDLNDTRNAKENLSIIIKLSPGQ